MPKSPNVLVFFTDQQRWDTVGAHGNPLDVTPNFDRLAESGSFVPNSFTCQPVCGPARSVLQTGRYPTMTGCFRNNIPLPETERTLAHHYAAAGYETAYIGKWHLASGEPVAPAERGGYETWLASNILEFTSWPYETTLYDGAGQAQTLPGYRVDAMTDAAIRYLATPRDKPFYLFLSFLEPHHQNQHDNYPAPEGYADRIKKRMDALGEAYPPDLGTLGGTTEDHYHGYMGMVARLDEAFGRIVDALISLNRLDDTIILFTSDHGCHFKTRNDEYKRSCHEASIRVPTLFHGPGFGSALTRNTSLIDLPPTLLQAAGVPVPHTMQGRSLLSGTQREERDIFIQISESQVGRALRHGQWKYCVADPDADPWNDPAGRRYVETHLYNLEEDPWELRNRVEDPKLAGIRAELAERLKTQMVDVGERRPQIEPAR